MSEPEIARRCPSCGASIRAGGAFCPQCGKPVSEQKVDSGPREESVEAAEVLGAAETVSEDQSLVATIELVNPQAATGQAATGQSPTAQAETVPLQSLATQGEMPVVEPARERAMAAVPAQSPLAPKSGSGVRAAVGRARAARDLIEGDVLQGVGKLREISTVVLDEASYDPSLRFVLVAAGLFILFLIILFLSEVMN